jgi:hypothetical protein
MLEGAESMQLRMKTDITTRGVSSRVLVTALVVAAASRALAFDANTANFKDIIASNLGNGRGDRDGGPGFPTFIPDGIPDVFQGWMAMYDIQKLQNSTVASEWNSLWTFINTNMTPYPVFVDEGATYCGLDAGGRQYWVYFAANNPYVSFTIPTATMPTGTLGRYGALDDPDGDGANNLAEFLSAAAQYGLPANYAVWTEGDWDKAYETNHGVGTGMPTRGYVENDVMSTFAAVALDPQRVPEPATTAFLALGAAVLIKRGRRA